MTVKYLGSSQAGAIPRRRLPAGGGLVGQAIPGASLPRKSPTLSAASGSSVAAAILGCYAPRGATFTHRTKPLGALLVAAATSSKTVQRGQSDVSEGAVFARRPKSLLEAQDEARALQNRLKSGTRGITGGECNKVLRALCQAGERWRDVVQVYNDLRGAGVQLDLASYRMLMDAAIEAKQGLDVVELLRHCEEAHGPAPPPLYCSLISRLLKHPGRGTPAKQAAYGVWRALRASGQRLDQVAYRTGMNLCVELGHIGEARRLMDAMRVAGFRPGWGAYHILMKYHASRGDMDGARRLFAQLRAYRGGKPLEISAYNTLLCGFVRVGDLTMARAVLDKARREGARPDAVSYSAYAAGLAAVGRLDEAEELLGEMAEAEGLRPGAHVYGALLDGSVRVHDWARVDRLLNRMRSEGLRPNLAHYNILIRGRCYSSPGYGGALSYAAAAAVADPDGGGLGVPAPAATELNGNGSSSSHGSSMGSGIGHGHGSSHGTMNGATVVNGAAVAVNGAVGHNGVNGSSTATSHGHVGAVVNGSVHAGSSHNVSASAFAPVILPNGLNGSSSPSPSTSSSSNGTAAPADDLSSIMDFGAINGNSTPNGGTTGTNSTSTNGSSNTTTASSSFSAGAAAYAYTSGVGGLAGEHVDALIAEMRAAGLRPDAVTYGTLIHAAVRSGSVDGALGVLSAMRLEGVAPDAAVFTSLMKLFRGQGMQAQALEFFQQLSGSRSAVVDVWSLTCLTAVHASGGNMEEAEGAARRAHELAAEQGLPPPVEAAYALVQGYGQQRRLRNALLAFRRFLASGGRPHRKLCEYTYRLCLAHFDFAAAGQVLRAMRLMRGLPLREELYRQQWEEAQKRMQARRPSVASGGGSFGGSSGGANAGGDFAAAVAEKWKWWFGLPNKYYESEWK
ncbi:hypothetical protein CHLRE_01g050500v5 [Chlamydomonas reinhardtii]|uniref:Pentacotripeptide-repeat region of PRORP domain-containing protein n=1 Tax=Chlamydomonas reinhardtii TaxID=3055 RepID=A0A2K3E800_CHLRE|nr:uncharacterized protein CHLRE_01g050500v5 [Chlamydomonas reinhardtii]PNW88913.1 hypothetical protein CHLRE_01g050500v5 [Chlamydomonas reinhardtii]